MMATSVRVAACAAAFVFIGAGSALAAPLGFVSVAGADVAQVHARIVHEAEALCRADYVQGVHSRRDLQQCVRDTTADAVARSGRADLVAYHRQLSGDEPVATVAALR
jgi:hypothetical protein